MNFPILIVDDEYYICEGLRTKLQNLSFPEIGEIRVCYSGEEALELCQNFKPAIVITDIKMAGMSGIDLIRELKKTLHPVRFLVLSGYDDYEYIRSAFQTGATDYLLKPILSEPLAAIISEQIHSLRRTSLPEVNSRQSATVFAERICRYLQNAPSSQSINTPVDQLTYPNCRFFSIGWDSHARFTPAHLMDEIYNHYYDCPGAQAFACSFTPNKIYVLTNFDRPDPHFEVYWEKVMTASVAEDSVPLAIGVSSCKAAPYLRQLFYEAENQLTRRLVEGYNRIFYGDYKNCGKFISSSRELPPKICQLAQQLLAKPELLRDSEMVSSFTEQLRQLSLSELSRFYSYFFGAYLSKLSSKSGSDPGFHVKNFYSFTSYHELEDHFIRKLTEYASSDANSPKSSVDQIRKYVDDHFTEPITMSGVADQFSFSYSHLSRLFHEKVGMSFQEYLISKRMNYAAELLKNPELSVQEVAYHVGYDNVFNFSRSFKNFFGMSPNHYRNL